MFIFLHLYVLIDTLSNNYLVLFKIDNDIKDNTNNQKFSNFIFIDKNNDKFELNRTFLEWFVSFTDAEGNFSIIIRNNPNFKINTLLKKKKVNIVPKYRSLTFQIGLHIANLNTLKLIQKELKCGNISISKNRCNYYISDFYFIKNRIIPLFDYFHLNSTKYSQFIMFKNVAGLIYNKSHLTNEGLSKLIHLKNMTYSNIYTFESFNITDNWLLGFIEGDATFSTGSIYRPRFKFECHIKEEKLFLKIQ